MPADPPDARIDFPDAGETPESNTGDASLWFFEAVRAYVAGSGDVEYVRAELLDVVGEIVELARSRHALRNMCR
jgi:hypothetical protein